MNVHFRPIRDAASVCRFSYAPSSFTASMAHRMFFGSRAISRLTSYVLSAPTLSSCAMM
jgi:hypothetical protein